ncbi:hypothetical protein B0H17DRAFT_1183820 [Mycena rosella]|uniref:Uncharacterized protein n=1 Tax=Mycena rosella TaxID=1033263 RepID=A0AAD7G5M3_MYCRO|nr:hypothetical protein B0H17DRAFT_1183820 [Mycena rosella]
MLLVSRELVFYDARVNLEPKDLDLGWERNEAAVDPVKDFLNRSGSDGTRHINVIELQWIWAFHLLSETHLRPSAFSAPICVPTFNTWRFLNFVFAIGNSLQRDIVKCLFIAAGRALGPPTALDPIAFRLWVLFPNINGQLPQIGMQQAASLNSSSQVFQMQDIRSFGSKTNGSFGKFRFKFSPALVIGEPDEHRIRTAVAPACRIL